MNDHFGYLSKTGLIKGVSKSQEHAAKIKVREHVRARPAVSVPMAKSSSTKASSAKVEVNESKKYEAAEKRAVGHFANEKVLREGHNTGAPGTYKGKSMKPGGGGAFAKMTDALKREGKSESSAKAIAASAGRKKYGKSKFQSMAAKGRARHG